MCYKMFCTASDPPSQMYVYSTSCKYEQDSTMRKASKCSVRKLIPPHKCMYLALPAEAIKIGHIFIKTGVMLKYV